MLVYRIEHITDGYGPMCGKGSDEIGHWDENFKDHPTPLRSNSFCDFLERIGGYEALEDYYFGMLHIEELRDLVRTNEVIDKLSRLGFGLFIYETKGKFGPCVFSNINQVCFHKESSTLIEIRDLEELYKEE